jgi:hypothetical protein
MSKAANRYKNEAILEVDGEEFILRPTFDAIARVEDQVSTGSIEAIVQQAMKGHMKVADAVIVIREFSKAGGKEVDDATMQAYFEEHGTKWIFLQLAQEVLPRVIFGGKGYELYFANQKAKALEELVGNLDDEDEEDTKKKSEELTSKNSSEPPSTI